ncbi:purine-nucleoside phosphorylase [Georgenia thermotolerans]|uniref:Purine nucleoside phosphorylase n=1 Tax=Georgenia thermotolerans TaxID=527326 RepID=A0A7J5UMM3_9MICO|nr:purine-nucleoside phosphorylase [Georgenia thermotolerans]KAE8763607.1 purine-nucleoside phosphorylase [Georgenia thermotolerans]
MTNDWRAAAEAAAAQLRDRLGLDDVAAGVVLGSGWGPLTAGWGAPVAAVPTAQVAHFRAPVAPGHDGRILRFDLPGPDGEARPVVALAGRTHLYEGHGPGAVAHGVRTLAALGAGTVVLTNANGSLRPEWPLGRVVALTDHLNLTGVSPLEGASFVDLTAAYDPDLRAGLLAAAAEDGVELATGVYAMLAGPHYETAAEAGMVRALGADVLGMSTVLEAIAAREAGLRVLALSTVTAHEASGEQIDPDEVVAVAEAAAGRLSPAVRRVLAGLPPSHPHVPAPSVAGSKETTS